MWTCGIPSTGETRFVRDSAVGEGSGVDVCSAVGIFVPMGDAGIATRGVSVGSGIPVGSTTGAGVAVQAVKRRKMPAMSFFMILDYMSLPSYVVARTSAG
jgi:hypothetical protein